VPLQLLAWLVHFVQKYPGTLEPLLPARSPRALEIREALPAPAHSLA